MGDAERLRGIANDWDIGLRRPVADDLRAVAGRLEALEELAGFVVWQADATGRVTPEVREALRSYLSPGSRPTSPATPSS